MAPQRMAGAYRTRKFFYIRLRVPLRCTASLWVTSLGTRMAPQRTAGAYRSGKFFYIGLRVPPRCTASLWVTSLGTRIQCGGTLSPLPSGRDSVGIGGDVQWNGLTVLLELVYGPTVASVLNSQLVRLYSRI